MLTRSIALASVLTVAAAFGGAAQSQTPVTPAAPAESTPSSISSPVPSTPMRQLTADALEDMEIAGVDGQKLADVEGVIERTADKKQFLIVERGGFLGIGATEIAIPIENVAIKGEKLVLLNMDASALEALPEHSNDKNAFRELSDQIDRRSHEHERTAEQDGSRHDQVERAADHDPQRRGDDPEPCQQHPRAARQ